MANPIRIYSGPGQLVIWDATNGYLDLGFLQEIKLSEEPVQHELMDGNLHQALNIWRLEVPLLQTDSTLVSALNARRGIKQKIYITGLEAHWTLENVFVTVQMIRGFSSGEAHRFVLTAQTAIESDFSIYENLLGAQGRFENDSDSDGLADGWFQFNLTSRSIVASFLSGEGNAQKIAWDGTVDAYVRNNPWVKIPFGSVRLKLTFSFYVLNNDTVNSASFKSAILLYDKNNVVVSSFTQNETLAASEQKRISFSATVEPTTLIVFAEARIWRNSGAVDITIDNAQLEIGGLTDFKAE